ncbi:MAG: 50S ribosomal protein L23 [Chloroflexota bacterium]|nr:MAG: 50S ribosomal protein L23 [Chloroflexota bacterium]
MNLYDILRRPIVTEKNTMLAEGGKYVFEVATQANKIQIRRAVETAFKVDVVTVNVVHMPGKMRRVGKSRGLTSSWKKAIVTLKAGQKIEVFEGV